MVAVGQEFGIGLAVCLKVSNEVAVKTLTRELGLWSFEGLTGAGVSNSKIVGLLGKASSHYQETSVPGDRNLSMGCLHVLMAWHLVSSIMSYPKKGA